MMDKALSDKILIIGIDGMDPRMAKSMMDAGRMPNLKKLYDQGACREDLVMQGNMPTITPPMWTTLATGACANTHGITCYWGQHPTRPDLLVYNFSSTRCKAEQLWNVLVENGKKTLVWHWPGSSWPPSSDSKDLFVVDGAQPGNVNVGVAKVDAEKFAVASTKIQKIDFKPSVTVKNGAGCVLEDIADEIENSVANVVGDLAKRQESIDKHGGMLNIMTSYEDGEGGIENAAVDISNSPLKPAEGWTKNFPDGTLEFVIVLNKGLTRRQAVALKGDNGEYHCIEVYKNKKAEEPIVVVEGTCNPVYALDEFTVNSETRIVNRMYQIMDLSEEHISLYIGPALDIDKPEMFSPQSLYYDVIENVGYVPTVAAVNAKNSRYVTELILPTWRAYGAWQAKAMSYVMDHYDIDVAFSHFHNLDNFAHRFMAYGTPHDDVELDKDPAFYREAFHQGYEDTDAYIGDFMHYLDEGWTIFVISDHGLLLSERRPALLGDPFGVNATVMEELGYTALTVNEDGEKAIDWEKTTAVAARGNMIYINLKGRNENGIVDPKDQYTLEEKIIDDLYNYRDKDGKRIISMAIRNKEAGVLGMSGPDCGDIVYFTVEGTNRVHGDSMSTYYGLYDTSVSPIFVGCGKGLKNCKTDRVIRQIDFAPTLAVLMGVRMPLQCEGAPVYQILDDDFFAKKDE